MSSSLTKNIYSGAKWTGLQVVGMKVFSALGQIILAWILAPEDFGKIALTLSITSFAFLFQNFGLQDVLVNRNKFFNTILPLAQSISLVAGIFCFLITLLLAFIGAFIYEDNEILYLILIYSLSIPFDTFSVIPDSKLRIDLRFKDLSYVQLLNSFFTQLLIIGLALMSFGVYSFVIAPVIISVLRFLYLNYLADINPIFKITFRKWRHVVYNSSWGFLHSLCQKIIQQSDYLILGLFVTKGVVGVYYLAYSLSVQVIGFVVNSISPVLFPTLMKIPKDKREDIKLLLLKITSYLSMIGMPFAIWQAANAEPLIRIFLEDKWIDTIPMIEVLSLGIGFSVVGTLWTLSLKLRAEFKKQALYSVYSSFFLLALLVPLTYYYEEQGTIIAVALYHFIATPLLLKNSFKHYKVSLAEILIPIYKYFILSMAVFGLFYYLVKYFDFNLYINLLLNGLVAPCVYVTILYYIDIRFKELILKYKTRHEN